MRNVDGYRQNFVKMAERCIAVASVVGLLLFAAACGGSGNNPLPPVNGNFSNASLSGQYTYSISGNQLLSNGSGSSAYYVESGVFTADGSGNITAGIDDFAQNGSIGQNNITGVYSINKDGSGDLIFNVAGGQIAFRIAMSDTSHFYLIEDDGFGAGAGSGELQTTSAFSAPPAGTFVFRVHETGDTSTAASLVGRMTLSGGVLTTGNEDILQSSVLSSVTLSGTANFPDTNNGRGTMTVTESGGFSANYVYYIVNSNTFRLMRADGTLALGRAEAQLATTYNNSVLSGSFVFNSSGDTSLNVAGVHTAGVFTADGSGAITAGAFDSVLDGNVQSNVTVTGGTYSVASTGRATIGLGTSIIINHVAWMVSPTRAFYLVNSPANVEDGVFERQAGVAFSNSTLNGQYAFFMDGFDTAFKSRTGTFIPDGNGNLRQDQVATSFFPPTAATSSQSSLTGTYSVQANGRTTVTVPTSSGNIDSVLYLVSNTSGYLVQVDSTFDIGGAIKLQQ